jgi:long-subunit acyl-CoA synthetase (AMP-forming)
MIYLFIKTNYNLFFFCSGKESDLWKWLVLNKARKRLGGNVRAMLSGGAPLTPVVHKFLTW